MEDNKALIIKGDAPPLYPVARALFKSGIFPAVKNEFGAYAIVQYGHELGVGPMTALQTMSIVQGRICMAGQMMLAIALRNGVTYEIKKHTPEMCEIFFKNGNIHFTSTFTVQEAKQAGIWKAQGGWEKYPQDMLYWRTVTRGLRRVCPDVITGLYAIEELQDAIPLNAKIEEAQVVEETPMEDVEKPPPLGYEDYYKRMSEIKNIYEMKAWWAKHGAELKKNLNENEMNELIKYKDFLKENLK